MKKDKQQRKKTYKQTNYPESCRGCSCLFQWDFIYIYIYLFVNMADKDQNAMLYKTGWRFQFQSPGRDEG